jgi:hypothetical protein
MGLIPSLSTGTLKLIRRPRELFVTFKYEITILSHLHKKILDAHQPSEAISTAIALLRLQ